MSAMPGRRSELTVLSIGVIANLLVLAHYKYAHFLASNFNRIFGHIVHHTFTTAQIPLPIGISFFTFHAISYIVDIYRRQAQALKNPLDMGLYISMFPQLVAGPIIRYHDVADQLLHRTNNLERFASGVERFVFGLGKKILLANTLGQIADQAFNTPAGTLSAATAWLGIVCYTLQIYFDFSGYSDMAIGLARMFGFELTENFNYPYISRSVREFWRRWHLSLSTWFRDYVYIPLGGNRGSSIRVRLNLFVVFFLCGLWHGASWNFAFWGVFHGTLLVLERGRLGRLIDRAPRLLSSAYTIMMIMIGWVFFRAETFPDAIRYLHTMFLGGLGQGFTPQIYALLDGQAVTTLVLAIVLSTPIFIFMSRDWNSRRFPDHAKEPLPAWAMRMRAPNFGISLLCARTVATASIMVLSISALAINTYNPFIYFRF
ncbi:MULTISPECIES: MBOAT family O-acyltransferase [Paraburkholderia]|uniref:MBOAT family O-acyltransferase n=1 Tax=Paraburkholderia TaxID=1822464 RepID=UPI002254BD9D|nr:MULTISPECIES: MBOAT family O-acyltransferase [Paraburkholderia]MCX4177458.1 MBOAT family protein [Paraburkholderia madseniana]MDQ6465447.1 MBOAT family protein [Paraburkholderia madseniana]